MNEITRTLGQVTAEIKYLDNQAKKLVLGHTIEIGRRLAEAKTMVPYGGWGEARKAELEARKIIEERENRVALEWLKRQKAEQDVEDMRKRLAMSEESTVTFKLRFQAWQNSYRALSEALDAVSEENREKLRGAVKDQAKAWAEG